MLTWKTPVRIGAHEFVFSGTPEEIIAFCLCYDKYDVIGSELNEDGVFKSNTGEIKIQLQDTAAWDAGKSKDAVDMIIKYTLERITKFLNPMKIIGEMDTAIIGADGDYTKAIKEVRKNFDKIKHWIPAIPGVIAEIKKILMKD